MQVVRRINDEWMYEIVKLSAKTTLFMYVLGVLGGLVGFLVGCITGIYLVNIFLGVSIGLLYGGMYGLWKLNKVYGSMIKKEKYVDEYDNV
jgi:hypothetical protein